MKTPQIAEDDIGGVQRFARAHALAAGVRAELPERGRPWLEVRSDLLRRKGKDYDWRRGRIPIYVYHHDDELLEVSREAYSIYFSENALGMRAFPSLARMEQEIVQIALSLFGAPAEGDGSFTSGGTESIFLSLKAGRDQWRTRHPSMLAPSIIVPETAHPAFDKAAHYLGINVVRTRIRSDFRADLTEMAAAIGPRTMMIVGSAPCYPFGVYDPIPQLGQLAISKQLWLHVDACLGGFLAPFARDEGFAIPPFDFSIPGVTSLSADLHKHGFSAKGASVLLYRSPALKEHQSFQFSNWPRGQYATETFLGTRPGGSIASAWAVANFLGRAGYRQLARRTMEAKQQLERGIERIEGLEVLRPSELSVLLYRSVDERLDINAVAASLGERGWFVGRSRAPQAIHLALNPVHAQIVEDYLRDLRAAVAEVRASGRIGQYDDMTY